jgi:hypothetical protein
MDRYIARSHERSHDTHGSSTAARRPGGDVQVQRASEKVFAASPRAIKVVVSNYREIHSWKSTQFVTRFARRSQPDDAASSR